MSWTDEMDTILRDGHRQGLSARIIAEQLGTTRNSVLGRTFRLGLCHSYAEPRQPKVTAGPARKKRNETLLQISIRKRVRPDEVIERLRDLVDLDLTWNQIAAQIGVSVPTVHNWATKYAGYLPKKMRRFTDEDRLYIRDAWMRNDHLEDIADKLNRSFGVIHQEIFRMKKEGILTSRDASKTRLLRQYGHTALLAVATPAEALKKISDAKRAAFATAIKAARDAKENFRDRAVAEMREKLAAGEDRDACIFAARAEGVTLETIAVEFGITRERVRQICNAYAQTIALRSIVNQQGSV